MFPLAFSGPRVNWNLNWQRPVEYLKEEIENSKHDKRKVRALLQRLRDQYSWRPAIY